MSHQKSENQNTSQAQEATKETPALNYPSHVELENQLNELDKKYNEALNQLRYAQAEIDNTRRRAEKEVKNALDYGPEKLIRDLLSVVDALEKSLEMMKEKSSDLQSIKEGMELTYKMLMDTVEKFGVKQVNPEGGTFDPAWHQAMTVQEQEGVTSGAILLVLQKGYTLHGRLLRPAMVIVAK